MSYTYILAKPANGQKNENTWPECRLNFFDSMTFLRWDLGFSPFFSEFVNLIYFPSKYIIIHIHIFLCVGT